jgi:hypothetical protein
MQKRLPSVGLIVSITRLLSRCFLDLQSNVVIESLSCSNYREADRGPGKLFRFWLSKEIADKPQRVGLGKDAHDEPAVDNHCAANAVL